MIFIIVIIYIINSYTTKLKSLENNNSTLGLIDSIAIKIGNIIIIKKFTTFITITIIGKSLKLIKKIHTIMTILINVFDLDYQ